MVIRQWTLNFKILVSYTNALEAFFMLNAKPGNFKVDTALLRTAKIQSEKINF